MSTVRTLVVRSIVRKLASPTNQLYRPSLAIFCAWIFTFTSFAQTMPPQTSTPSPTAETTITLPAGTHIPLVLTHPVQSRNTHRGDDVYAQIASPVTSGNQVIIPPGTFIEGKVNKLENKNGRGILHFQSMSITFPNGYVATISSPVTVQSDAGYVLKDPGNGRAAGVLIAPLAGAGLGALIGRAADNSQPTTLTASLPPDCGVPTPGCMNPTTSSITEPGSHIKGIAIGTIVGAAIGTAISLTLFAKTHSFYLDAGAPLELALDQPLVLQQNQVTGAIRESERHPLPLPTVAPRPQPLVPDNNDPTTCYYPGSPGTPDIDIPGTPATDDSSGTPPVHIAGIPPTLPSEHPCP